MRISSKDYVAKNGTEFEELPCCHDNEGGVKVVEIARSEWAQLQRLVTFYDSMCRSVDPIDRERGREGRYAAERAINIITGGWCNR